MNKKIMIFLAGLVLAVSLAACTAAGNTEAPSTDPSQTTKPSQTETTAPSESTGSTESSDTESETAPEELTLVEDNNCTVKVTAVETGKDGGCTIKVYLENKTDKELMFTVDDVSVNGFMCDPFWASTVSAGKKSNEKISFSESDFKDNDIQNVESVTFTLKVYDSKDMDAADLVNQEFTVTP